MALELLAPPRGYARSLPADIELGTLEGEGPLALLEVDPRKLGRRVHGGRAALAAEAAVLDAAEGRVRLIGDGAVVDMHHTGLELHREAERLLQIIGDDRGGQAIRRVIGEL